MQRRLFNKSTKNWWTQTRKSWFLYKSNWRISSLQSQSRHRFKSTSRKSFKWLSNGEIQRWRGPVSAFYLIGIWPISYGVFIGIVENHIELSCVKLVNEELTSKLVAMEQKLNDILASQITTKAWILIIPILIESLTWNTMGPGTVCPSTLNQFISRTVWF